MYRHRANLESRTDSRSTPRRRIAAVMAMVLAAVGFNVLAATSASAACPAEYGWYISARTESWILTNQYSNWQSAAGSVSFTKSTTVGTATSQSVGINLSANGIIFKAEAQYSKNWEASMSQQWSWTYTLNISSGQTARAAVYKKGSRFTIIKWSINSLCQQTNTTYYQWSPYGYTTNDYFCVGKDVYPATSFIYPTSTKPGCNA